MKAWKDSASLILAARHAQIYNRTSSPTTFQYNYKLLCLKRHQKSSFMPGSYVFPGGAVHPADSDLRWQKLFSGFGFDSGSFTALFTSTTPRPNIFRSGPNELPREISLRITAIRETFEECGVLLCKPSRENDAASDWAHHTGVSENELQNWQAKVHDDASEFYALCEKLKCYPDLWSLYEWSNWLTPTYYSGKRFNTIFYLACMPFMPSATYEDTEMEDLKWDVPRNFLLSTLNVVLPAPQYYEIARIANFESVDNLLDFAVERSKMGIQLNLPVIAQLKDGIVHLMPGDSMYPKDINLLEKQVLDKRDTSIMEFRDMSPVKNRMETLDLQVKKLLVDNLASIDGHLSPVELETIRMTSGNKK